MRDFTNKVRRRIRRMRFGNYGGYKYSLVRTVETDIRTYRYLKCKKAGCPGTAKLSRGRVTMIRHHTHAPRRNLQTINQFELAILQKIVNTFKNSKSAYADIITENPQFALICSYSDYKEKIKRWQRKDMLLPVLNSFGQFLQEVTNRGELREHARGELDVLVRTSNNNELCIIGDLNFVHQFAAHPVELVILTSESVTPTDLRSQETVTFSFLFRNFVFMSIVAFVPNKELETYRCLLQTVKDHFLGPLDIVKITTTIEERLYRAVQITFQNIPMEINFSDYVKAMVSEANLLHMDLGNRDIRTIFRKIIALPFLQRDWIPPAFTEYATFVTQDLRDQVEEFLESYQTAWLPVVTSEAFSFHQNRNVLRDFESIHLFHLQRRMRNTEESMWDWYRSFVRHQECLSKDVENLLRNGRVTYSSRIRDVMHVPSLVAAWTALDQVPDYNVQQFLGTSSILITSLVDDIIFRNENRLNDCQVVGRQAAVENVDELEIAADPNPDLLLGGMRLDEFLNNDHQRPRRRAQRAAAQDLDDVLSLSDVEELDEQIDEPEAQVNREVPADIHERRARRPAQAAIMMHNAPENGEVLADAHLGGAPPPAMDILDGIHQFQEAIVMYNIPENGEVAANRMEAAPRAMDILDEVHQGQEAIIRDNAPENGEVAADANQVRAPPHAMEILDGINQAQEAMAMHNAPENGDFVLDANQARAPPPAVEVLDGVDQGQEAIMVHNAPEDGVEPVRVDGECQICRDGQIEWAFNCGHIVCEYCIGYLRARAEEMYLPFECPFCRAMIRDPRRIFLTRL